MSAPHAFDVMAATYDKVWTYSPVGCLQRDAFWKYAGGYFRNASRVLDIGCGTGEDAALLMRSGLHVTAIDASPRMVSLARSRGVEAQVLPMEHLSALPGCFDIVMSNFGALNCVPNVAAIREPLARLTMPGGYAIFCVFGRFCAWEIAWYFARGDVRKAARRWRARSNASSGVSVFYHSARELRDCFSTEFDLVGQFGIGICVPPSYVRCLPADALRRAARFDESVASSKLFRSLADHRLLIFRRKR